MNRISLIPLAVIMAVMIAAGPMVGLVRADPPATPAAAAKPQWPSNREGAVFLWRNGHRVRNPAVAHDSRGELIYAYALTARGHALFGRNYEMTLGAGWFEAEQIVDNLIRSIAETGSATIEAWITPPAEPPEKPARIVTLCGERFDEGIGIAQRGEALIIQPAADAEWIQVHELADSDPFHLAVTATTDSLTVYINSQPVFAADVATRLAESPKPRLIFGDPENGAWSGSLEGVAIYNRALGQAEIGQNTDTFRRIVESRRPVPRIRLTGTLLRRSDSTVAIKPYHRALALFEYRVDEVLSGEYKSEKIWVFHWTVMQQQLLPLAQRPIGKTYELLVEPFDAHPQLESELQRDTLDWELDQPAYYDIVNR